MTSTASAVSESEQLRSKEHRKVLLEIRELDENQDCMSQVHLNYSNEETSCKSGTCVGIVRNVSCWAQKTAARIFIKTRLKRATIYAMADESVDPLR